mmetsp:Transcript_12228/g.28682  ORF Transcript_12228/g.28682 Transcript_12228/m.28682 type:complete len:84 (+) Transcript_12228:164-415(+)
MMVEMKNILTDVLRVNSNGTMNEETHLPHTDDKASAVRLILWKTRQKASPLKSCPLATQSVVLVLRCNLLHQKLGHPQGLVDH